MTKLTKFMNTVAHDMYVRFNHADIDTEEGFDSMENMDIKHEAIDGNISSTNIMDIEDLIHEFGIGKAIFITLGAGIEVEGMDPRQLNEALLYQIVMEKLDDYFTYEGSLHRGESNNESDEEEEEEEEEDLLVSGIYCRTCKFELPEMKMSEHLDKNNPKNKCKC